MKRVVLKDSVAAIENEFAEQEKRNINKMTTGMTELPDI